jgi:coenzyme F420 hydrogenase subunit beta
MCLGCGACAYICPEKKITLVDFVEEGIRPVVRVDGCNSCSACLEVCPGYDNDHAEINGRSGVVSDVSPYCGPVLEIWEGHASDPEIRHSGSSGGLITALALYCLEQKHMRGVLHIGQDPKAPCRNKTRMSRTRAELLATTGSRYAPASACDRLDLIDSAPGQCVFVGQPSEVTALRKAQRLRPELDKKVGLVISFFCAGSPSTRGTLELLKKLGVDSGQVEDIRYRGNGWPGNFAAKANGGVKQVFQMSYEESWSFLQAYRPYSTHLCPDGTGEDADVSCGDPWYRKFQNGEPGSSLVVVRTELGRRIIHQAMDAGYIELKHATVQQLLDSQRNLINKRKAIWGRIFAFKLFGLPTPKLKGFCLFKNWCELPFKEKLRSTLGTVRRIVTRRYFRPLNVKPDGKTDSIRS